MQGHFNLISVLNLGVVWPKISTIILVSRYLMSDFAVKSFIYQEVTLTKICAFYRMSDCSNSSPNYLASSWTISVDSLYTSIYGIMLPSIFEKHKICSNGTKSLLIVNRVLSAETMRIFGWKNILLVNFTILSAIL